MLVTDRQSLLWQKIEAFPLDEVDSSFTFTDRLCRENGWSYTYAIRVVQEYKKFMYLICTSEHPLTPSDQVDQVWHLHLLYTLSYWVDFCGSTLGREVHHGPTKGGGGERQKFDSWYERTSQCYRRAFNCDPPADIWPPARVRFGELKFRRVNLHRYWVVPKFLRL